jgi:hypothetical protein
LRRIKGQGKMQWSIRAECGETRKPSGMRSHA